MAQKKHYYIPQVAIVCINTTQIMGLGDPSNKGGYGHAPERRVKVF